MSFSFRFGKIAKTALATGALCAALAPFGAAPALASKADDTVHIAFSKELETADVYYNTSREGLLLNYSVWDGLLYRDPKTGKYVGNLATSWKWLNPTTIEFHLRHGVKFQNGEPFSADDVVYTLTYVTNPKNGIKNTSTVNWIDHAEKVDDYTVKVFLKAPFPAAEEYFAGPIAIYPKAYYEKVGPTGMGQHPIGTGPFKVVKVVPGKEYVLEANKDYFDGPKGKPGVEKVDISTIPDVNTQIAEFFNGRLDFIWNIPADLAEKLKAMGKYNVVSAPSMRIGYIAMDAAGRSGKDNPMTKLKVREAVAHAINRKAIVEALVKGSSKVIDSACSPVQTACAQDLPTLKYDPAESRKLLAEAGYPNGFTIDFSAYRDRSVAEAIMGDLNAVGIKTNFSYMKYAALRDKVMKGEIPITFMTWGSNSIADASAIDGEFFTGGSQDMSRDPKVMGWLKEADATTDKEKRADLYKKALSRIVTEALWVPLFTYNINYAMDKDLDYTPTPDGLVRFYDFHWKK